MMNDLDIFAQASAMAKHAAKRHEVIARNVANADTPHYKAVDLPAFDPNAATGAPLEARSQMQATVVRGLETTPNGNSVSLEDQMVRSAEAQAQHEAALQIYRSAMDLLRIAATGRR